MNALSPLCERLGLRLPIIQAPMAGVSTPALAAAVSNAGALGSLGLGAATVEQAREAIARTRALTDRAFNVNVFCHAPAVRDAQREQAWLARLAPLFDEVGAQPPAMLREIYRSFLDDEDAFALLLETRPAVLSFHFGVPAADRVQALRAAGMYTLASVTSLEEAARAESAGVDALVGQGIEAGGHRGVFDTDACDERLPTAVLLRQLVTRCRLPVIAAGGIMDGAGIRAVLDQGAAAAQLGTAFVLCPESAAGADYRRALQGDTLRTTLTSALSGRPARGLVNCLVAWGEADPTVRPAMYPLAYDVAKQLIAASAKAGRTDVGAYWAGQGVPLARALPAADLVRQLAVELERG